MNLLFMANNGLPPYGIPRSGLVSIIDPWRDTYGRNILPSGSENFVTGWTSVSGETITVTDYPTTININGVDTAVIAKRIQGTGNGDALEKYLSPLVTGLANPHTSVCGMWAMSLGPTCKIGDYYGLSNNYTTLPSSMTKLSSTQLTSSNNSRICLWTGSIGNKLDIVVYQPQINIGTLYPYAPPSGLPQSTLDYSGRGNTFQLGSAAGSDTNDPKYNGVALVGDGVDDYAVASFASATYRISIVDSGSGYTFVNEVPAYLNLFKTGASTYLNGKIGPTAYYNRVLTAGEIAQAKAGLKRYMASKGVTVS